MAINTLRVNPYVVETPLNWRLYYIYSYKENCLPKPKAAESDKPVASPKIPLDVGLVNLASKFGVSGAVILVFVSMFIVVGTKEQHLEFINKFFLLKFSSGENIYVYFVFILLAVLFIGQAYYSHKRMKLKDERISQLETDLRRFQDAVIKKLGNP